MIPRVTKVEIKTNAETPCRSNVFRNDTAASSSLLLILTVGWRFRDASPSLAPADPTFWSTWAEMCVERNVEFLVWAVSVPGGWGNQGTAGVVTKRGEGCSAGGALRHVPAVLGRLEVDRANIFSQLEFHKAAGLILPGRMAGRMNIREGNIPTRNELVGRVACNDLCCLEDWRFDVLMSFYELLFWSPLVCY